MKSPMVTGADYVEDKGNYSELQVMHSAAGYYIGTVYHDPDGFDEPGSRDSGYYPTREKAQEELDKLRKGDDDCVALRDHP